MYKQIVGLERLYKLNYNRLYCSFSYYLCEKQYGEAYIKAIKYHHKFDSLNREKQSRCRSASFDILLLCDPRI